MGKAKLIPVVTDWHRHCADVSKSAAQTAFQVSDEAMNSQHRCRAHIALARQIAMYLCHTIGSVSMTHTAQAFGRDRKTVSHACQLVEDRRDEPHFELMMEQLSARVHRDIEKSRIKFDSATLPAKPEPQVYYISG